MRVGIIKQHVSGGIPVGEREERGKVGAGGKSSGQKQVRRGNKGKDLLCVETTDCCILFVSTAYLSKEL